MRLPFHVYDVFTDTPFAGNPLAIVEDAGGLSTAQMQTIAREFNLSETIFVMAPADPAHAARVRIFFPTDEIPFAGHPTIGCALHLAGQRGLSKLVLEEEAGLVPVTITGERAEFTAPVLPEPLGGPVDPALAARAVGLDQVGFGAHRPAAWIGGPGFVYLPVPDRATLARARPIEPHWTALMEACAVDSAYLYCPAEDGYAARMFSPTAGIPEDPATGSASAILAAQLLASGALGEGTTSLKLTQGEDMGRRSSIGFSADVASGALTAIRISGQAVPISSGHIRVP
ncbi:PhzF family phenazine biosynthesis protein [Dinoroseobacter sp. PD6]|uniref:PhzF family phenazine biosynthesis protein n=1 Tax=Dinoroseobacter sp. PD6 TaxID=3028384 RepID=UPI00237C0FF2|nr:PhzF family phenazine biosynthesis protein [Dinoroseobacter sp. PD6]MDD9717085.1 PhzF family phenazine biosynthesis protein [Dinoroseobacter sp. PD6]